MTQQPAARLRSGARVEVLDAVDSTNAEAMRRIGAGERGPLWLAAVVQTGGRGRAGRAWVSPPGNLHASLVVALDAPPAAVAQLSLVAGVAVFEAVTAAAGRLLPGLRLKWPNDLLLAGAKLAGILPASTTIDGQLLAAVGVGINLACAPADLGRRVARLGDHVPDFTPQAMLDCLDTGLAEWLQVWQCGLGFDEIRAAWLARAGSIGARLSVHDAAGVATGAFAGLDRDGAMLLRLDNGTLRRVAHGDVHIEG